MASIVERPQKDGTISYRVQIRLKGFPAMEKSFDNKKEAEDWAINVEQSFRNKTDIPRLPLSTLIKRYLTEHLENHTIQENGKTQERNYLGWWEKHLGKEIAVDLRSEQIEFYANELYKVKNRFYGKGTLSQETRRRYLQCLGRVYKKAIKDWKWAILNPVEGVDLHIELKKKDKSKIQEDTDHYLEFKKEFVEVCLKKISEKDDSIAPTSYLMKELKMQKSTVQHMLDADYNSNLHNIFKLANFLGIKITIGDQ